MRLRSAKRAAKSGLVLSLVLAAAATGQSGAPDAILGLLLVLAVSTTALAACVIVIDRWTQDPEDGRPAGPKEHP